MQRAIARQGGADRRVLIVALILGAIAAGLAVAFLASAGDDTPAAPVTSTGQTRFVVVASEEIPVGTVIEPGMIELRSLPVEAIASGVATDLDLVVGETARYPIAVGEQVNAVRLVAPPEVRALSFQIPMGQRAFTVPVSSSTSPASLMVPGDFVDILVAAPANSIVTAGSVSSGRSIIYENSSLTVEDNAVATLLQNIQVLTVQRDFVANGVPYDESVRGQPLEDDRVSYVTLAVTPEQAQLLWLASQEGQITLTLRAFGDDTQRDVGAVSTVLGGN